MLCDCGGTIIKFNRYHPNKRASFAQCDKCFKYYTCKQYRSLQASKLIEMVKKEEGRDGG